MRGRLAVYALGVATMGVVLSVACVGAPPSPPRSMDSTGSTSPPDSADTTTAGPDADPDDAATTVSIDATGPNPTSTSTDPSNPNTTASSESTSASSCDDPPPFYAMLFVDEASLIEAPMTTAPGWGGLPGAPTVAYSQIEDQGSITFTINIPCDGAYILWGLTWDRYAGVNSCRTTQGNADNFWVSVDGDREIRWSYGCHTCGLPDALWTWNIVTEFLGAPCSIDDFVMVLSPGIHQVRLRNRESGSIDNLFVPNVAAIAAIAITNDAAYDPNTDYMP